MNTNQDSNFRNLQICERVQKVAAFSKLTEADCTHLLEPGSLDSNLANYMIENVIGTFQLPLGVALNFLINGKEYLIPMVLEEASVVAAASNAAKMARAAEGFLTDYSGDTMIAQIQCCNLENPHFARHAILRHKDEIIECANEKDPVLIGLGGGVRDVEVRVVESQVGRMVVTHLLVDTMDAMGANTVNTMAEAVAPLIENITGGTVKLRILSNLADRRLARASAIFSKDIIGGEAVVDGILSAHAFASADPYRAATSNKGVMNGVDPIIVATGNDWRAVEAGVHAYCARNGRYTTLTQWEKTKDGDLVGSIELPMPVGLVGGATKTNPLAGVCLKILKVESAAELAQVIAAVGLAQNFAALRALATEGIQSGHMKLHARNIAAAAGVPENQIDRVVKEMISSKSITMEKAKELVDSLL